MQVLQLYVDADATRSRVYVLYRALVLTALLDIVYATYFKIIVNDP
jgi:hypothetical protein